MAFLRLALGAAGLGLLLLNVLLLAERGFALTPSGVAGFVTRAALAIAFLAAAYRPERVAAWARAPRLATPGGLGAFALMAVAVFFVFGLGTAIETARLLERVMAGESPEQLVEDIDRGALLFSLSVNMAVFTLPAIAWAAAAEGRGPRAFAWLGLRPEGLKWSLLWTGASVILVFWMLIAAGLLTRVSGVEEISNPRAEAIARSLDIPLALLVAAMTGIGEEIFFRGWLQRKVGVIPQAILFGIAHLNYLQVLEVVATAALGYMFGRTVQKTGNLWGPIVGHAAFNATSLIIIISRGTSAGGLA